MRCNIPVAQLVTIFLATIMTCGLSSANDIPRYTEMESNRNALTKWLAEDKTGAEFYTESKPSDDGAETNVALFIENMGVEEASTTLNTSRSWCEVMFLHLNVKACVHDESPAGETMTMYMGRKYYQNPKKAEQIELEFNSGVTDDGVIWVSLTADEGPFNTSDYFIGLFAIEAENGVYAQLRSSQKASSAISGAMDLYFQTLARGKVGFSIVGTHKNGEPKYSTGAQAMLERNVVRYLLALRVYMDTHKIEGAKGMTARTELWYDATENYPEQLHEVKRKDYLHDKKKEYQNQQEIQAALKR